MNNLEQLIDLDFPIDPELLAEFDQPGAFQEQENERPDTQSSVFLLGCTAMETQVEILEEKWERDQHLSPIDREVLNIVEEDLRGDYVR